MKAVIQRVTRASVVVEGKTVGQIDQGLLVFLGVAQNDTEVEAQYLVKKISSMRIFSDSEGKMNLCVKETGGSVLAISQFTLLADTRKGNRPSFIGAADPSSGKQLYQFFCEQMAAEGIPLERGIFGADMKISLLNDGPVTIVLDTNAKQPPHYQ